MFLNYITKIIIYFGMTKYFPNFFSKKITSDGFLFVVTQKMNLMFLPQVSSVGTFHTVNPRSLH